MSRNWPIQNGGWGLGIDYEWNNEKTGCYICPKCLETSRSAKIATEFLSVEASGMANLVGRKDWRTCPKASYFYSDYMFIWLGWVGWGQGSWVDVTRVWSIPPVALGAAPLRFCEIHVMLTLFPFKVLFLFLLFLSFITSFYLWPFTPSSWGRMCFWRVRNYFL